MSDRAPLEGADLAWLAEGMPVLATIITARADAVQLHQFDLPTVKDCLVAWAGRVAADGMTDEARTRLRGDMADFDAAPTGAFENTWKFESDLGLDGGPVATVIVVETVRR